MILFGILFVVVFGMFYLGAMPKVFWNYTHKTTRDIISYFYVYHFYELRDLPYEELLHMVQVRYNVSREKADRLFKEASEIWTVEKKACTQFTCLLNQD